MFCHNCGSPLRASALFCHKCGTDTSETKQKVETDNNKAVSFKDFVKKKGQQRSENIAHRKSKKTEKNVDVKINVGLVALDKEGINLKIVRGSSLPVTICKKASDIALKRAAKDKHLAHNKLLRAHKDEEWVLLYPDLEQVFYLPGTRAPFTVIGYQESIGKPFSRVTLYICRKSDFEADSLETSAGYSSDQSNEASDPDKTWTSSDEITFKCTMSPNKSPDKAEEKAERAPDCKKPKIDLTREDDRDPIPMNEILCSTPTTSRVVEEGSEENQDKDVLLIREYAAILNETYNSEDEDELLSLSVEPITGGGQGPSCTEQSEILLEDILLELASPIATDSQQISKFNICRSKLWEGVLRSLRKKSFSPTNKISVKFMDEAGETEGAVDMGGPQREFFTLALQHIMDSPMFHSNTSKPNEKVLNNHGPAIREDHYYYAGCVISLSLVHGGPAPNFFSNELFEAVVKTPSAVKVLPENVPDQEIRDNLLELQNAQSEEEMLQKVEPLEMVIEMAGAMQPMRKLGDQLPVVEQTAHWYIFGRTRSAFDRFCEGLETLGVLQALKQHPEAFRFAFCGSRKQTLRAAQILDLFKPLKRSERGSNGFVRESEVLTYWTDYVEELEDDPRDVKLEDLLFFATGVREIPPIGFRSLTRMEFSQEGDIYPRANTCSCTLLLPLVHTEFEKFKEDMNFALANAVGFGHP